MMPTSSSPRVSRDRPERKAVLARMGRRVPRKRRRATKDRRETPGAKARSAVRGASALKGVKAQVLRGHRVRQEFKAHRERRGRVLRAHRATQGRRD